MREPRLSAELVPSSTWGWNLRTILTGKGWDFLRQREYERAGSVCEICGGKGRKHPVECHERWDYNDHKHVQTLVGLEALCPQCHEVRHIGRAMAVGRGEIAFKHLAKVNGWTLDQAEEHVTISMKKWQERSRHVWKIDISWLEGSVPVTFFKAKAAE